MSAKLSILDELGNILRQKEKKDEGVLTFSKQFNIGHLLKLFSLHRENKKHEYGLNKKQQKEQLLF